MTEEGPMVWISPSRNSPQSHTFVAETLRISRPDGARIITGRTNSGGVERRQREGRSVCVCVGGGGGVGKL